ncbi:pyridoxal-phosphate dependent enzyme [Pedobacter gandavensis]|uniref:pyridoxal-phosphate dependent enzyme n=1 Tax=Pedobacter gandavensis TaxID=2679963 RepID=UPI0024788796|nr:pyridoxal-phosphate dependent enzyme [Pedobacter gandavensis]WGQ10598.1 pyridoxal-phosphate dependent enzyme [Pedobacter gandavensis]
MKGIWKYKNLLPAIQDRNQITLGEGNTPLLRSRNIGPSLGLQHLYFKLEHLNPSGSYKDRFAAMVVSNCLQQRKSGILATSSGNTGAALAAYSAAADLKCLVALVDGAPFGKIQQMGVYGSELLMIKGFGIQDLRTKEVMDHLKSLAVARDYSLEISAYKFSPVGMEGVQTIAFEIAAALPEVKHVFVPAGGGGLYLSILLGFSKWQTNENEQVKPMMYVVQPSGNDTIASLLMGKQQVLEALDTSETCISGLQVPSLLDAQAIYDLSLTHSCNGATVEDEEVYLYQKLLAQKEGIFCEPAGAVALAGLIKAMERGEIHAEDPVVCLVTGNGPKDLKALDRIYTKADCAYAEDMLQTKTIIENKLNR